MANIRKPPTADQSNDWGPWTAAHFLSQDARDRFVRTVGSGEESGQGAEPVNGEERSARVRWRSGRFLGLNDIAYAHGGRIVVNTGHDGIV